MTATPSLNDPRLNLGDLGPKLTRLGFGAGIIGLLALVVLWKLTGAESDRMIRSYLMAFMFVLSISLGAFFFVIVQHVTRAGWSVVIRRVAEGYAGNLQWLGLAFLPILAVVVLDQTHIYHWIHPEGDPILEHKAGYLNVTFWTIRAIFYFAVWFLLSRFFLRNSIKQDGSGDVALTHRMQWLSPLSVALFALTATFAAIDWVMSLESHWFSTMFGVYFFAGCMTGFFGLFAVTVLYLQKQGKVVNEITAEHHQDMGKLLFAFGVVFWAYIGFSQYMLIWYANIPEETTWFLARYFGPWRYVTIGMLLGHFVIPFVFLVTKHTKRIPITLAAAGVWMLLHHLIDTYWMVMPVVPADILREAESYRAFAEAVEADPSIAGWSPSLMDLAALVGLGGIMIGSTAKRLSGCALIPVRDPRLGESLAFENM